RLHFGHPRADRWRLTGDRGLRGAQEVRVCYPRNLNRVLHGEEETRLSALVDTHLGDLLPIEQDRAARDLIARVSGDRVRQGRLARTVGSHDGVGFTLPNAEVHAVEDGLRALIRFDADVQVLDLKKGGHDAISFVTVGSM